MFQRDYILRMIEQISQVMARLLMLKTMEERQEALFQLEEFYGKLMLPPVRLLLRMRDQELLSLISVNGQPDLDRAMGLGLLLKEEGRLYESMERYEESGVRFNKSLFLFLEAFRRGAAGMDCRAAIEELRSLLRPFRIPGETLAKLVEHYEAAGNYAAAEDALFEWLEAEDASQGQEQLGEGFYSRLLALPDEALEGGGLPRDEVYQGRLDMRRRLAWNRQLLL